LLCTAQTTTEAFMCERTCSSCQRRNASLLVNATPNTAFNRTRRCGAQASVTVGGGGPVNSAR
jgi:hypothetical protein